MFLDSMSGDDMQVDGSVVGVARECLDYLLDYTLVVVGGVEGQERIERITIRRVTGAIRVQDAAHIIELNEHVLVRHCYSAEYCSGEIHPAGGRLSDRAGTLID